MTEITKPQKNFDKVKTLIRVLLCASIFLTIISCIFTLSTDAIQSYALNYISIIATSLILYFSVITIIIISIYKKLKKGLVWETIKKETILIILTFLCLLILIQILDVVK